MTVQYRNPLRQRVPQLLTYTFLDQNSAALDLSLYAIAFVELLCQGDNYLSEPATIQSPATAGVVRLNVPFAFPLTGVWTAQFVCVDVLGNRLYGEPLQFTVVPNVDTLATGQLAAY